MALPQARHDALFRLLVSDPGHASRLLRDYLPSEVVARLDPEHPPVHVEGTAIDGEGSRTQSDAIFRLHLRDGGEAIVYTLLEHKSRVDHRTPLQLIRYVLKIWAMEMDTGHFPVGGLPLVIPIVFFHGREPWTVPCSIQEMIHAPEGLEHSLNPSATTCFTISDGSHRRSFRRVSRCVRRCWRWPGRSAIVTATQTMTCLWPELRKRNSGATY